MPSRFPPVARLLVIAFVLALSPTAIGQQPVDPPRGDYRFVVFGDFNGSYGALEYAPAVAKAIRAITDRWRPELLLSPGDVVAGQNRSLPVERFGAMWQLFDREVAGPLRQGAIPYAVAMGNHDASSLQDRNGSFIFEREREAARHYWSDPMNDANLNYIDRQHFPFDYAFRTERAFVVVLDASSADIALQQREWLKRVLGLPTARSAALRIVVGHLPLAPVGHGRDRIGEVIREPAALRRILEGGNVDLYISGHHAAYYPGRLEGLELLFAGGVGARRLLAGDQPARSTVTLVDVWWEPLEVRYSTFDLANMQLMSPASLPPVIGSGDDAVRLSERAYPAALEPAQR
ncbi:MAG: metallophosphoesterase [Trueperaceae bacterium]